MSIKVFSLLLLLKCNLVSLGTFVRLVWKKNTRMIVSFGKEVARMSSKTQMVLSIFPVNFSLVSFMKRKLFFYLLITPMHAISRIQVTNTSSTSINLNFRDFQAPLSCCYGFLNHHHHHHSNVYLCVIVVVEFECGGFTITLPTERTI